jgi:hypothetical protein
VRSRSFATAGLRQPLLVARRSFAAECVIHSAESHTQPRAAGVSPPWLLGKRTCRNFAVKSRETAGTMPTNAGAVAFVCHGWLTPAAPGCTTFVRCGMRDSQCGVARTTKSGGRQPAVVRRADHRGVRIATRPPLLRCSANVCRRNNDFCDTYIRPRAAGVSPPWLLGKRTCRNVAVKSRGTAGTMPTNAGARSRSFATGGLRQPLLLARVRSLRTSAGETTSRFLHDVRSHKCVQRGVSHPTKSGGRQPAVAGQTRIRRHEPYWSADRRRCVCGSPLRSRASAPRG